VAALAADLGVGRTVDVIRGTMAGLAVLLVAWVALAFLVWEVVARVAGREEAMRLVPYVNVHLLEEAEEGTYAPWRDPVFLLRLIANTVAPFAVGAWVAGRINRRAPLAVSFLGVVALLWLHRQVFTPDFPSVVRAGFVMDLAAIAAVTAAFTSLRNAGPSERAAQQQDEADEAREG